MLRTTIISLSLLAFAANADAANALKLKPFAAGEVKARCDRVHGRFFVRDSGGAYGCTWAGGLVECSPGSTCVGYPRSHHAQPAPAPAPQPAPWFQDQWGERW
jgi:hypothetical protein